MLEVLEEYQMEEVRTETFENVNGGYNIRYWYPDGRVGGFKHVNTKQEIQPMIDSLQRVKELVKPLIGVAQHGV